MSSQESSARPANLIFERRRATRFPIQRDLQYRLLNRGDNLTSGLGKTLNISRCGVLFTAQHHLPLGSRVEVSISWPTKMNNQDNLSLVARGRIERSRNGQFVLFIQQHKFHKQTR